MNVRDIPIYVVQWGPETEPDETAQIEEAFGKRAPYFLAPERLFQKSREEAFREYVVRTTCGYAGDSLQDWLRGEGRAIEEETGNAQIASFRFTSRSGETFLTRLGAILSVWDNPQALYLSMHGNVDELSFDKLGTATISFAELSDVIGQTLTPEAALSLVLGCCKALNTGSSLLNSLPDCVQEVYGFTGAPPASCVSKLFVGVLLDNARLYQQLHSQNQLILGSGVTGQSKIDNAFDEIKASWNSILDDFEECPNRLLNTPQGESVRVLKRVAYGDKTIWQGYTIDL